MLATNGWDFGSFCKIEELDMRKFTAGFEGARKGMDYLTKGAGEAAKKYGPYAAAAGAGALLLKRRKDKKKAHQAKLDQMKKESVNENIIGASFAQGTNQGKFNNEVDAVKDALAQIQELSPQTMSSYQKKAGKQYRDLKNDPRRMTDNQATAGEIKGYISSKEADKGVELQDKMKKRGKGLAMSKGKGVQQEYAAPSMSAKGKSGGMSRGKGMRMSHYKMEGEQRIEEQIEIVEITLKHQKGQPIRNIGRFAAKAAMVAGAGKLGMDAYNAYKAGKKGPVGKYLDTVKSKVSSTLDASKAAKVTANQARANAISNTVKKAANIASKNAKANLAKGNTTKRFATMSYELEGETAINEHDYQKIDEAIPAMAAQIAKSMIANKVAGVAMKGLNKGAKAAKKGISLVGQTAKSGLKEAPLGVGVQAVKKIKPHFTNIRGGVAAAQQAKSIATPPKSKMLSVGGKGTAGTAIKKEPHFTNIRGGVKKQLDKKFGPEKTTPAPRITSEGAFKEMDTKKQENERLAKKKKGSEYSDKEVRMGSGVAFDKRYKGGNMTGAYKTINKIKKGLGDHPKVADALRRANEQFNNEGE